MYSATSAISITSGQTPSISISNASSTNTGAISSTDWTTFNNKLGTADNGLTATSGSVKLGGTLTAATTIYGVTTLSFEAPANTIGSNLSFKNPNDSGKADFSVTAGTTTAPRIDFRSHGASYSETLFGQNISGKNMIFSIGDLITGTSNAKDLIFGTNNTEIMRINSTGFVGIGTNTPSQKLHVSGGDILVTGGCFTVGSDRRIKKDIKPFRDGLEKILKLNPVSYKFI